MNKKILSDCIQQLFANSKGLLAMDESLGTCNKRFAAAGIPQTEEMRRRYRQLLITTKGLQDSIGGVILFDETIRQKTDDGTPFTKILQDAGIIIGIKVDKGTIGQPGFPNEKITEGLDGLRNRLQEYKTMGARFAKWRAVIRIGENTPTQGSIEANIHALARYAALCQEADIVPIVEPEVLMEGDHTIWQCFETTERVLKNLIYQFYTQHIWLEGIIIKPNMVISGTGAAKKDTANDVAEFTVKCLLASIPPAVPAIAFLSGGQSPEYATMHLDKMHELFKNKLPWILSFSFARAIQQPTLDCWKGDDKNIAAAQKLLLEHAETNKAARQGNYIPK
ncbi:MAG: fructose-bisphosphate aldolase class I [Niastella sp.]|nr:fructose-bisphosphate aldolase class I [Niastella sp.]